jgi:uncharacterized membrane protein
VSTNELTTGKHSGTHHLVERWIGRTLRFGVWISAGLMIAGLLLAWFSTGSLRLPSENPSPGDVFRNLLAGSLDPVTLMFAGLLLLMLTPFLRVLTAAVGFAAEKDRRFVVVALVVFAMLVGELVFSLR